VEYRIGVDIGGTFTDCVVVDDQALRHLSKSLTVPEALDRGVLDALDVNAAGLGISRTELLSRTSLFVHSTTQATNAILTRRGARTGLITTRGHEQSLLIGNVSSKVAGLAERDIIHTSLLRKPEPIIPRRLIRGIDERVDSDGDVLVALDEVGVASAIDSLLAEGVEAIAVSFLWSFLHPEHELRVRALLDERAPNLFTAFSHEVAPVIGEYERTATTALTAYVGPTVSGYLQKLDSALRADGLSQSMLVMQASGSLTSVADASRRPLLTLDSGPTGGVLGCRFLGELYGSDNLICTDVGGTSFDVGLVVNGEVPLDDEPVVSQYALRMPKVLVRSIGAGGGSIAWIDEGGLLRVGPQSARSNPGPACYGRGGTQATVTDADLVLGYLDADAFLDGRMQLHRDLALTALGALGHQLGLEPEEVAVGISTIINAQMADLIRRSTIEVGHDPRGCVLVAYGGAGPTHAVEYAKDIGAQAIIVPADSTVYSAEGILTCDIAHTEDTSKVLRGPFTATDMEDVGERLHALEQRVLSRFADEGIDPAAVSLTRSVGMRFGNQVHSVEIRIDPDITGQDAGADLIARFSKRYGEIYGEGAVLSGGQVELELHRAVGTKQIEPLRFEGAELNASDPSAALIGHRNAWFGESGGFVETAIFHGERLSVGNAIPGPAIIERMGDSVVVPPGYEADVDTFGNIALGKAQESRPTVGVAISNGELK
jgi:N-methylhydantoinase A